MIRAEVHSDDNVVKINFDATDWFTQATEEQIVELARCGWRGDYPADEVAMWTSDQNSEVARVFAYLEEISIHQKETLGFECSVNAKDAIAWLKANQPQVEYAVELAIA
jgi:hypothetical protein